MDRYDGVPISHMKISRFCAWVHLYNLPLSYFSKNMLRKVASVVKTFVDVASLPMDQPSEVPKASFAKMLIEMDINAPIVPSF